MSILNPLSWFRPDAPSDQADRVRVEPYIANVPAVIEQEEKASAAGPLFAHHSVGRAVWTERRFDLMAHEAYQVNAVAHRCVKMIAGSMAGVPLLLMRNDTELGRHELLDLLDRPNPTMGGKALLEAFYSFLLLSGNAYLESVGPTGKPPRELWPLRSDRMMIIAGPNGIPLGYEYSVHGRKKRWMANPLTGQSDVLHCKEFDPLDDWYGQSRIAAAAYGIDRNNAAAAHNKALLDNGARPSGMMVFEPLTGPNGQIITAPKDVIGKAETELMSRHGGPNNAGKPLVVNGKVTWVEMGLSPKDMDHEANKDDSARDICLALGVPPVLIVKGDSTYNNLAEAKLEFYETTVLPLLEMVLDDMNNWLTPRFGDGLALVADLDGVSALEPRRVARRSSVNGLIESGVIDADEGRDMLRYGARPAGSVKKVDPSVITALINAASVAGIVPLARYMRSVGLVEASMTDEQILAAALDLVEDDEDEDDLPDGQDGNSNTGDPQDDAAA